MTKDQAQKTVNIYHDILKNMVEGVVITDSTGNILFTNPRFCDMVDCSLSTITNKNFSDFIPQKDLRKFKSMQKKNAVSYECSLIKEDKKEVPVFITKTPIEKDRSLRIILDMSEVKKTSARYQNLVETMNEAVWLGDENERTVYANPKFCDLMESDLEELLGRESYEFWDEKSAAIVREVNLKHRQRNIRSSYEGNLRSKTGKIIPVLLSGTSLPDGGTTGIMTDLRVLKQKEKQEKILNIAINFATDAIIIFDNKGNIKSWNAGAKIIFGFKADEIIGKKMKKIFPKETYKMLINQNEILYNAELNAFQKNKAEVKISATLNPISSEENGEYDHYLLIARDISHHKRLEEELVLKYKKLKDVYQQYGDNKRKLEYFVELLNTFKENNDLKSVADFIVSSLVMITHVDICIMRRYNEKKNTLEMLSGFGITDEWQGKMSIKYENSLAQQAYKKQEPIKIIDVTKDTKYQSRFLAKKHNCCSLFLIPLIFQDELIGSLSLYANPEKKLEIFENEYIEHYAKLIEMTLGCLLKCKRPIS